MDHQKGGHGANPILLGNSLLVIDVDLDECDLVGLGVFRGEAFEVRGYHLAWATPVGVD